MRHGANITKKIDMAKKYIKMEDFERKLKVARVFGVTRQFVDQALRYDRNSDTARKIRRYVMNDGGILFVESDDWKRDL